MVNNNVVLLVSGAVLGLLLGWILNRIVVGFLQENFRQDSVSQVNLRTSSGSIHLRPVLLLGLLPLFVTMLTFWRSWTPELLNDLILGVSLFSLAIIDWESLLIDSRFVMAALGLRLFWLIIFEPGFLIEALCGLLVGAGLLYLFGFLYESLRKRQGLGEGDPALLGLLGLWVGWPGLGPVLLIAALSGILIGGFWLWLRKEPLFHSPIPFGPFLCLGGLIVHLLQQFGWMSRHLELTTI